MPEVENLTVNVRMNHKRIEGDKVVKIGFGPVKSGRIYYDIYIVKDGGGISETLCRRWIETFDKIGDMVKLFEEWDREQERFLLRIPRITVKNNLMVVDILCQPPGIPDIPDFVSSVVFRALTGKTIHFR